MDLSYINPHIRIAMQSVLPSGFTILRRVIYDYELISLERGEFTFTYDSVPYLCPQGALILIHPGVAHSFQINHGDISQPHIHFDLTCRPESPLIPVSFKDVDKMTDYEKRWIHQDHFPTPPSTPFLHVKNTEEFLRIFYRIVSKETDNLTKKGLLIQILSILIRDNFPEVLTEQGGVPVANQIKDYIDAGNGLSMSLDDFEKSFFHTKFHLEKKFKKAFGMGLIEYRNKKRMEIANHLLEKHPVSHVAQRLNYQSIYSFRRAYKQYYGITPSQYRNSAWRAK